MSMEMAVDLVTPARGDGTYRRLASFGLAMAGGLSWLSFLSLPYEISLLIDRFSITAQMASWIASSEVLALALAVSIAGWFLGRADRRLCLLVALAAALASDLVGIAPVGLAMVVASRIVFGLALGVVSAASNALAADHPVPERMYAYMMVGLSVIFCCVMYGEPMLAGAFRTANLPAIEAILIVAFGWAAFYVPRSSAAGRMPGSRVRLTLRLQFLLISIFILFLANSIIWAFADQAAAKLGIVATTVAPLFTVSGVLMLGGGLAATWLGDRRGYLLPLLIGAGAQAFSSIAIYSLQEQKPYFLGVLIFNATLVFALPYAQAVLAELDESGTAVSYSGAAVNFGGALGPAAGALFFPYGFPFIGYSAAILSGAGILMVLNSTRLAEQRLVMRRGREASPDAL